MKTIVFSLICLFCFIGFSLAETEYYQYVDKDGVRHFTEFYEDIPNQYKSQVKIHKSISSPVVESEEKPSEEEPLEVSLANLNKTKIELEKEYERLSKQQQIIDEMKEQKDQTPKNEMIRQLNSEIDAYQKKVEEYEQQVSDYNTRVQAKIEAQKNQKE